MKAKTRDTGVALVPANGRPRVSKRARINEGRPTTYTEELSESLLDWMSEGNTARSWCKANEVGQSTVAQWRRAHREFAERYARAREDQGDAFADMAVDDSLDMEMSSDQKRIVVDTRKWFASKMRPKVYGDRLTTELTTGDSRPLDAQQVVDGLVALANAHPITAEPLRKLLQSTLDRLPVLPGATDADCTGAAGERDA